MKKILLAASVFACLAFNTAFADMKVGVIDSNKVLTSAPQLDKAKKDLENKFSKRAKKIEEDQKKFQQDVEGFSKNGPTMKSDDQEKAKKKIIEQQQKLKAEQNGFQKEAEKAQNTAFKNVWGEIEKVVNKVATDKKLDLVFAKASLAFNKKGLDITDEVIKQLKK